MKIVLLWTDIALLVLIAGLVAYARHVLRSAPLKATWRRAFARPSGASACVVLLVFAAIGLADSLHFRLALPATSGAAAAYSGETTSLLDVLFARQANAHETTYSAPLAYSGFQKEAVQTDGRSVRDYPRLTHGGAHLKHPAVEWRADIAARAFGGVVLGALFAMLVATMASAALARRRACGIAHAWRRIVRGETGVPLRAVLVTIACLCVIAGPLFALAAHYHVFGTDRIGNDVFYVVLKSVRTALVIGSLTTLITLPIAVGLGLLAGYCGGWIDAVVQYVYTVVNSIPYVLLIAASILILQIFIDDHPAWFQTAAERTDARLFFLCVILGLLSWTELCRLVRGETLKLRELDYVQAAHAFGLGTPRILVAHLLPNVMHLVLIYVVISFSSLVLAEAVLSYVGIGVDPSMQSFGTLINTARFELARDPSIWWTLGAAFVFMFAIVLAANVFSDAVRDAFDPHSAGRA